MALTQNDLNLIKETLKPEFDRLEKKLSGKIERFRRENRKDHNLILAYIDRQDSRINQQVSTISEHLHLSPL